MNAPKMHVYMWVGNKEGNGYDVPGESVMVFAVAHDLGEARRELDKILDNPAFKGSDLLRTQLRTRLPQVYEAPWAMVNYSSNNKTVSVCTEAQKGGIV